MAVFRIEKTRDYKGVLPPLVGRMLAKSRLNSVCFEFDFSRSKLKLCCVSIYLVCHLLSIIKKFPPCIASTHTALVLKEPKTKTSIRRVYLPKTVAKMLVDRKAEIDELKDLFGDEYIDNDLVFCTSNGRPMESQIINRAFNKLIKENGFPHVVFHSLRHSSITYKLKLNGGDMKAVQGDSGHAQMKMVADVYSHIIDEDRCINAQRFEDAFYSQAKAPEPAIQEIEEKETGTTTPESDTAKILELLKNPETAALLKQIVSAL